jgi:hypothetical protein
MDFATYSDKLRGFLREKGITVPQRTHAAKPALNRPSDESKLQARIHMKEEAVNG